MFWNCDCKTIFQTAALSTNSLWDFVVFGNYDFHTVSVHSGDFNQFPRWGERGLWCFRIVISTPFSTQRSFQPISWGMLWCFGIVISRPFPCIAELPTNSLWGDSDCQTVCHTSEFSTNSLSDFGVFWNSDFHTVFNTADLSNIHHVVFWTSDFHKVQVQGLRFKV